ncbi:MAG: DUF4097 domain-containing protein [Sandaracinaceae bacterium]|nr:DUF4097 domain-containing protein [Sandaracinaceae bacterium]
MTTNRHSIALAVLVASGCTLGVDAAEIRAEDTADAAGVTLFRGDLSRFGDVRVTGIDEPTIRAAVVARGLIGAEQEEEARESVRPSLHTDGSVAGVTSSAEGPLAELLTIDRLELDVPAAMGVDLTLGSSSAHVSDVLGLVRIRGTSGSVELDGGDALDIELDSGSVVAEARSARLRTESGSMELVLSDHVDAAAGSGSIVVRLAGGGELHADTGSIDITLEGPLTEDLNVSTGDGSVRIHMLGGVGAELDLSPGHGSVEVYAAGERVAAGYSFVGTIGAGGHTIQVRTGDGSIVVDAADEAR